MPNYKIAEELTEKLRSILRDGVEAKSSTLLRAYATFAAMEQTGESSLLSAYSILRSSDFCPRFAIAPISQTASEASIREAMLAFRQYSAEEFLRFIVSDLCADASALCLFYRNELGSDFLLLAHHLIQVRRLLYSSDSGVEEDVYDGGAAHPDNPTLLRLYKRYCMLESDASVRLSRNQFESLYQCVNVFPIRFDERTIRPIGYRKEELNCALDIKQRKLYKPSLTGCILCVLFEMIASSSSVMIAER